MTLRSYRDLAESSLGREVWQKAIDWVVECDRITKKFPSSEAFGLASPLQRAAVSIAANIAEGQPRQHTKAYLHILSA